MRICHRLDMCDVEIFLGSELFERSSNSRIHVIPRPLISQQSEKVIEINTRNTISLSLIALRRSVHPMPSFDPPGSVSKFVNVVRRVHLNIQDMDYGRNLVHPKAINHFPLPHVRNQVLRD